MKRRNLLVAVLALGLTTTMVSCKKDYTCKCTKTYTKNGGSVTVDDNIYTYKDSRVKAEKRCNDNEGQGNDLGGDFTRDCDIQ
ncbi:MAG TPA: hypothetical protein VFF27_08050 [Bacteroidia bacterium]|jgi:hypothetical protein|nr:hypothetical protein [Bacteroidia bacterium]